MNQRLQIIEHRGNRIITGDLSALPPAGQVSLFGELANEVVSQRVRLIRLNARDTVTTEAVKTAAKAGLVKMENALGSVHISIVGLTGIQRFIANMVARGHNFAISEEDANDWLAEQGAKLK